MERIYKILLDAGYPKSGIDWLRRHRLATILILALLAWVICFILAWGAFATMAMIVVFVAQLVDFVVVL